MRIEDHLNKDQKQQLNKMVEQKPKRKRKSSNSNSKPKEEKIDWEDIMNTRMDTYKRVRGAIRRR